MKISFFQLCFHKSSGLRSFSLFGSSKYSLAFQTFNFKYCRVFSEETERRRHFSLFGKLKRLLGFLRPEDSQGFDFKIQRENMVPDEGFFETFGAKHNFFSLPLPFFERLSGCALTVHTFSARLGTKTPLFGLVTNPNGGFWYRVGCTDGAPLFFCFLNPYRPLRVSDTLVLESASFFESE